jgi:hypothetical protein
MILLLASLAFAAPGRTHAGLNVGVAGVAGLDAPTSHAVVRGAIDYGLIRHVACTGELGLGGQGTSVAGGLLFEPVDSKWLRVGVALMPDFGLSELNGSAPSVHDVETRGRVGLRLDWLAFWGLSFTARVDRVAPLDGAGWTEIAGGIAVRM